MYNVSQSYLDALASKAVTEAVTGTLILPNSGNIAINDSNLVSRSLRLTKELCGEKYRIGTFNLSCLKFSFFSDDAMGLDLTGGSVTLSYKLASVGDAFETVPLGTFLVDPILSSRHKDVITIVAYDAGVKADREPSDTLREMSGTPVQLIIAACGECGIDTDLDENSLDTFPNSGITVSPKDRQIQSCRDIIMWCAYLLCGYAIVNRESKLVIISAKYSVVAGGNTISTDRVVTANERRYINATDTRAYIKYMSAYKDNDVVNYRSTYVSTDEQAAPAAYALDKNPLLAGKTPEEYDVVNRAWLAYIDSFKQRGIKTCIYGDPAIDVGDTLMFTGGDIDQRGGIIGIVTSYEWIYREGHVINCSAADCVGSLISSGTISSTQTKLQSEKRIDAVSGSEQGGSGGVGENVGQHNERFNGYETADGNTITGGDYNHAEGYKNTLLGCNKTHITGGENTAQGVTGGIIGGENNTVTGSTHCIVGGYGNTLTPKPGGSYGGGIVVASSSAVHGYFNAAFGQNHDVIGDTNNVSGVHNVIRGDMNNVCGTANTLTSAAGGVTSDSNIVGGVAHTVNGDENLVIGDQNAVTGSQNLVGGNNNTVSAVSAGCVGGNHNIASWGCFACGYGADSTTAGTNPRFMVGNGAGTSFYINASGDAYGNSYNSLGADYAEYFEWADGNPGNEDRRGLLVALDGDMIIPANGNGFFGIISAGPSVIGNAPIEWHGKYKKDIFGCMIYDDSGKPIINQDYDPDKPYIPRDLRPEWAAVGLVGRLVVTDDGSCEAGGYCTAKNGIAAGAKTHTRARVLRRIDDTHVEVLIK